MPRPKAKTSQRFSRAAKAERDRLHRQRQALHRRREAMQSKVDALDGEMEAVDQQLRLLESLAGSANADMELREVKPSDDANLLSGSTIRSVAVPLLLRKHGTSPIHYRDWYALFTTEGYAAAGKRPDAVFLNQVSRSPLVRGTTKSGFYVIDVDAVTDLREQLSRLQAELGSLLADVPNDGAALEARRKRQHELNTTIARTERELREAVIALEDADRGDGSRDSAPQVQAA